MAVINRVLIRVDDCKGCGLCVDACPVNVLDFADELNAMGYRPSHYKGEGCTGCGTCYYTCPETQAITVVRNIDGLDEGHCPHCNATVKLLPGNRDKSKTFCVECLKPVNL
ncbi:MAG: 4Fe-4S dicluster domain-containing protein [Candidatus Marinimicrobia bacterium]|nr:4Fe-4S dicluster domain-containing protein [Candidatus Neomarinimicrobiota bacterium]